MGSGIKGQKQGGIWDHSPGIWDDNPRGSGSESVVFFIGSRIRRSGSTEFCRIRDQNFSSPLELGIKNLGKITGSAMKKYTSLRPWCACLEKLLFYDTIIIIILNAFGRRTIIFCRIHKLDFASLDCKCRSAAVHSTLCKPDISQINNFINIIDTINNEF